MTDSSEVHPLNVSSRVPITDSGIVMLIKDEQFLNIDEPKVASVEVGVNVIDSRPEP